MALPTMCPHWVKNLKSHAEISVEHFNKKEQLNAINIRNDQYFKSSEVQANKIKGWTSKNSFIKSMSCVDKLFGPADEKQSLLELRRNKLHLFLLKENALYQDELKKIKFMRVLSKKNERVEHLQAKKEEQRKLVAAEKDYDYWRKNEPRIREIKKSTEEFDRRIEEQMAKDNLDAINNIKDVQVDLKKKQKQIAKDLCAQISELDRKNKEAESLRAEEIKLQEHNLLLLNMEKKRDLCKKQKEKQDLGHHLIRQNKQQLKLKSRQIQESLEMDLQMLEEVARKEAEERAVCIANKERLKADAQTMRQIFTDQLQLEKIREAELEDFYQENANLQWRKRENEWEREAQARERLVKMVLEERQKQIHDKIAQVHEQQTASIAEREKLLAQIEEHKLLMEKEQFNEYTKKKLRQQEILDQISARENEEKKAQTDNEKNHYLLSARELSNEALIKREAERINTRSVEPSFRRRKVIFT